MGDGIAIPRTQKLRDAEQKKPICPITGPEVGKDIRVMLAGVSVAMVRVVRGIPMGIGTVPSTIPCMN